MATFIPGVGDVTPQVEYFKPNLELMAGFLETKQGQFNAARDELNSVYTTLKSLDLTLDENKQRREQFFNTADQELKKLANVDLSLPQNISAAKRLFNPLVEDAAMNEDLLFTAKIKNVVTTAEKFRNSSNEEDRKRYNPLTAQYAALKQQEYINASPEARTVVANSGIRYASNVNLMERATALANEMDLNVSIDSVTGGYRVTNKNGQLVVPHLQEAFTQAFMSDPEVTEYYKQKAYVDIQTQVSNLASQMGYDGAVQFVSEDLQMRSEVLFAENAEQAKAAKEKLAAKRAILENKIETEGVVEGSEAHREYLDVLRNLELAQQAEEAAISRVGNSVQQLQSLEDLYNLSYQLDLTQGISSAAQTLAMKDAEQSIKADEYALEQFKQNNRMNIEILKGQIKSAIEGGGGVDAQGNIVYDPVQSILDNEASTRGATMAEQSAATDLDQTYKALGGYIDAKDDIYKSIVVDFMSAKNGGALSSMGGATGKEATTRYLEMLDQLSPQDRAAQISKDLAEIEESGKYDPKLMEDLLAMENAINAASQAINTNARAAYGLYLSDVSEEDKPLADMLFNGGELLTEDEFVLAASTFINQQVANPNGTYDQSGLFEDYRQFFRGSQFGGGYKGASEDRLRKRYQELKDGADKVFKNANVNIHSFFDPDMVGTGSAMAFEVVKSYSLDPLAYYDPKRKGHKNATDGYTILKGMSDAVKATQGYMFPGNMSENDYLMADGFAEGNEYLYGPDNIGSQLLVNYIKDTQQSQKSGSLKRPGAILDVSKSVVVGGEKYVVAQITYDSDYISELSDQDKGQFKGLEENQFTLYVPQRAVSVGYFAGDGTGSLMTSIRQSGERTTQFPDGLGSVTYTYDAETGMIEVFGKIKELDPENGGYIVKQYVESTSEENFEIVRNNVWTLVESVKDQNKEALKQLEAAQGITRVTDPNKLK